MIDRLEDDASGDSKPLNTSPPPAKVIKRYSNRKLYDTDQSKYVTLDEIGVMIKAGEEIQVIDNETKEDLTSVTLTQIIYEQEKRENKMPLAMLRNLIQTGGATLHDFLDRSLKVPVAEIKDSAEHRVEELRRSAVNLRDAATKSVTELTDSARRIFSREERRVEEFRRATTASVDDLATRIEMRLSEVKQYFERTGGAISVPPGEPPSMGRAADLGPEPAQSSTDGQETLDHGVIARTREHVEALRTRLVSIHEKLDELHQTCSRGKE